MRMKRRRRGRRKRGSKLQCKLPQQCNRVVLVTKAIVPSPVNEEKQMEEEEEEITTTMQSSVAMRQSCTCRPKQFLFQ